jgi:hypothetical protein
LVIAGGDAGEYENSGAEHCADPDHSGIEQTQIPGERYLYFMGIVR